MTFRQKKDETLPKLKGEISGVLVNDIYKSGFFTLDDHLFLHASNDKELFDTLEHRGYTFDSGQMLVLGNDNYDRVRLHTVRMSGVALQAAQDFRLKARNDLCESSDKLSYGIIVKELNARRVILSRQENDAYRIMNKLRKGSDCWKEETERSLFLEQMYAW